MCTGPNLRFSDVMGHKSLFKALVATFSVLFWGVVLLLAAQVQFLARWLKNASPKPGEGTFLLTLALMRLYS